ncbi:hypothetical protein SLA2020_149030 [Shorea laevis]
MQRRGQWTGNCKRERRGEAEGLRAQAAADRWYGQDTDKYWEDYGGFSCSTSVIWDSHPGRRTFISSSLWWQGA